MAGGTVFPCDEGYIQARGVDAPCRQAARPWILAATILGSSLVFINGSTVNVALPALQANLGATVVDIQWVVNIYTLFLSALLLLGGSLGDHYGRRRIFVAGAVLFAAASLWCGLAANTQQLILARAVQGVGGALLTPGSLAIISASFPQDERGQAIGLWSGFSALTSAAGPLLGGWLIDTFSWRWIFFMLAPIAAVVVLICLWRVPESRDEEVAGGLDWWGAVLVTVGLGGLTYGLIESSSQGFTGLPVLGSLAGGVLLLMLFVLVEARSSSPMLPLGLFRVRAFSGANGLTLLLYAALGGALFFLPLNLIQVQGYSATAAGAAFLPFILLLSLLSRWSGGLVSSVGPRLPLIVGPTVTAAGFALFTLPGIGGSYWTTFFPPLVVIGLGMAVSVAPLTTVVMGSVPDHYAGTASGINNAGSRVAGLFAVAALGIVMVGVFGRELQSALLALEIDDGLRQSLLARRTDLANLALPPDLDGGQLQLLQQVIHTAFIAGFRTVMWIAAALSLLSALIAWLTIDRRALDSETGVLPVEEPGESDPLQA